MKGSATREARLRFISPSKTMRIRLSAWFLISLSTFAQDPLGSLEGKVLDPSSAAVQRATVSVLNLDTGYKQTQATSAEGFYKLSLLPVGQYRITVEHSG